MRFLPHRTAERRLTILFALALLLFAAAVIQLIGTETTTPSLTIFERGSTQAVTYWQSRISQTAVDPDAHAQLGLTYLQQVREGGDLALYVQAEAAFATALTHDPENVDALVGQGILALARHDFPAALTWGEKARAQNPYRAQILGVLVDAYVELGRYDEAVATTQAMVDLRPDLASYSRISYIRELHGDVAGAISAMEMAAAVGTPGTEQTAWTQVELGHLYLNSGRLDEAEAAYQETLFFRPDYPYAQAGLAQVAAARGDYRGAITQLRPLVDRLPLPEFSHILGDLYTLTGDSLAAAEQYDLVRAGQADNAAVDVSIDLEMAIFEADYGDKARALALAQTAYEQRPNIFAAEALAWALYNNGKLEAAWRYSQEALRLDTQDAHLYYRAGIIAQARGDEAAAAYLAKARAINPAIALYHEVLQTH